MLRPCNEDFALEFHISSQKKRTEKVRFGVYVTGEMDLLGNTDAPRRNGFAVRQIHFVWIEQADPFRLTDPFRR